MQLREQQKPEWPKTNKNWDVYPKQMSNQKIREFTQQWGWGREIHSNKTEGEKPEHIIYISTDKSKFPQIKEQWSKLLAKAWNMNLTKSH